MEERLLEHLTCGHEWMRSVSGEFDVSVKDTTVGSAHANVAANPSREEQEFPIEQVPFRSPGQRDVIHPEGLHFGGQPSENTDDENHGEHHRLHGAHLDVHLFGHHLLLKRHGLFLQNGVAGETSFVHDLPNLSLTVTDVGLVHRVDEKIANDGVQGHRKNTENHDGDDEEGLLGKQGRKNGVCGCSKRRADGRRHDEDGHQQHEHQHHEHGTAWGWGRWRR